jgi:hypothetical protein
VQEELGIRLDTEKESADSADVFKDLHLKKEQNPVKPLIKGTWD